MTVAEHRSALAPSPNGATAPRRLRLMVGGAVQGVGFRPYVYRLGRELGLAGWVLNTAGGVLVEAEGSEAALQELRRRLEGGAPPGARVQSLEAVWLDPTGDTGFAIRESQVEGEPTVLVRPDVATCPECVREIFDPADRHYRYPFTNCTYCGPRYSIVESLPYDRGHTSMRRFAMCPACQAEYDHPADRRFHAQPNACPACGPQLALWAADGTVLATRDTALLATGTALRDGQIVAVKGLGGFHLMVDARSDAAVLRLRTRKHREEKPLALMFPSLAAVRDVCEVSEAEATLLAAPEAPIVLLRRRLQEERPGGALIADAVAPGNPYLGVVLPYTPLHHLLLAELGFPIVATSGNLSDEPICTEEHEARERLRGIADLFLTHDRPIVRHVDDSVVRIVAGRELVLRRARGYAPLPVLLAPAALGKSSSANHAEDGRPRKPVILGVGGHLKNTVALGTAQGVFVSQHIGDLETATALDAFRRVVQDLPRLLRRAPEELATDLHPDYLSSKEAAKMGLPRHAVQHHFAHVLACLAENELDGPVLGLAWDGTGYGLDGTIWGGEFLVAERGGFQRFAALRPFPLPGGDQAMREPRRAAFGLLYAWQGDAAVARRGVPTLDAFAPQDRVVLQRMLQAKLRAPLTSSMGRLFDAVASLTGVRQRCGYEGQAAMELEWLQTADPEPAPYAFSFRPARESHSTDPGESSLPQWWIDWAPVLEAVLEDVRRGVAPGVMSARFHRGLVQLAVAAAERAQQERVVLAGGCFQNRTLLEGIVDALRRAGRRVYWPQRVPPNDGGLALGQVVAAWWGRDRGIAGRPLPGQGHNHDH